MLICEVIFAIVLGFLVWGKEWEKKIGGVTVEFNEAIQARVCGVFIKTEFKS